MAHRNKEGVTSRAETDTDLAAKLKADADDPDEVRNALDDAAGMSRNLWLAFLTFGTYLVVAVGSVKHRDLFLETPIKLPALNVELPLVAFFYVAPLLFLIFHAYLLLNLRLMVDNVRRYNEMLERAKLEREEDDGFRLLLTNFPFVQLLAGTSDTRRGPFGKLLLFIVWITVALAPVVLLLFMQLTFLPYHDGWATWWHRFIIVVDLTLLWVFWPSIIWTDRRSGAPVRLASRAGAVLTSLIFFFSVFIATFPGERLNEAAISNFRSPYELLFLGPVNEVTGSRSSLLDNTLVLPDEDFIDDETLDKTDRTRSLRGRDLRGAVLARTDLRKADFTGAVLDGADLTRGRFDQARFGCAKTETQSKSGFGCAKIEQRRSGCTSLLAAVLERAQLREASFVGSQLEGANFTLANLQGANLQEANLQDANLTGAKLQGADLTAAKLLGTNFESANLQVTDLTGAKLQRANLTRSKLQGADLTEVEVWRASFPVDLADKSHVFFGVPKVKISPPTEKDRVELRQDLKAKVTDGKMLKRLLDHLDVMLRDEPAKWNDEDNWSEFISQANEPSDENQAKEPSDKNTVAVLTNLACGDPHIALGMAQRAVTHSCDNDGGARDYAQPLVRTLFEENCKGAKTLSDEMRAALKSLRSATE